MSQDRQDALTRLAAIFTLLGVRFPEAPMYQGIIEGPFDFSVTWATGATAAKDFLTGAADSYVVGTLLAADDKLYQLGFTGTTGRIPGVLFIDGIGLDLSTSDALPTELPLLRDAWKLVHVVQGNNREQVMGCQQFARVLGTGTTDTTTERIVADAFRPDMVPMTGGPWKVNTQTDQLQFQLGSGFSAVTLAGAVRGSGRIRGVFVVEALAQQLGILSATGECGPNYDQIAGVIAGRRAIGQPV